MNLKDAKKSSFPNSTGFHQTSQKHSLSQIQHLESLLLPIESIQTLFKFYLSMHPPFQWQDTRTESCRKRSTMRATLSSERSFLRSQNVQNSLTEKRSLGKRWKTHDFCSKWSVAIHSDRGRGFERSKLPICHGLFGPRKQLGQLKPIKTWHKLPQIRAGLDYTLYDMIWHCFIMSSHYIMVVSSIPHA